MVSQQYHLFNCSTVIFQVGTVNIEILSFLIVHRVLWSRDSMKNGKGGGTCITFFYVEVDVLCFINCLFLVQLFCLYLYVNMMKFPISQISISTFKISWKHEIFWSLYIRNPIFEFWSLVHLWMIKVHGCSIAIY